MLLIEPIFAILISFIWGAIVTPPLLFWWLILLMGLFYHETPWIMYGYPIAFTFVYCCYITFNITKTAEYNTRKALEKYDEFFKLFHIEPLRIEDLLDEKITKELPPRLLSSSIVFQLIPRADQTKPLDFFLCFPCLERDGGACIFVGRIGLQVSNFDQLSLLHELGHASESGFSNLEYKNRSIISILLLYIPLLCLYANPYWIAILSLASGLVWQAQSDPVRSEIAADHFAYLILLRSLGEKGERFLVRVCKRFFANPSENTKYEYTARLIAFQTFLKYYKKYNQNKGSIKFNYFGSLYPLIYPWRIFKRKRLDRRDLQILNKTLHTNIISYFLCFIATIIIQIDPSTVSSSLVMFSYVIPLSIFLESYFCLFTIINHINHNRDYNRLRELYKKDGHLDLPWM